MILLFCASLVAQTIDGWTTERGSLATIDGVLQWEAQKDASIATAAVPADWSSLGRLLFRVKLDGDRERTIVVRVANSQPHRSYWRRVAIQPGAWQTIELKFHQFRTEGVPDWRSIARLSIELRGEAGKLALSPVEVRNHTGILPPFLEPDEAIVARLSGDGRSVDVRHVANFRIISNAPLDLDRLGAHLGEFLSLFRKTLGLKEEPLRQAATLVITPTRDEYVRFVVRTARDVYGADADEDSIKADGYTFEQYSVTSFREKLGEKRPVFFHEVCHQLVTRELGLRGEQGATWVEEGLCYFFQYEHQPSAESDASVRSVLEKRRAPLSTFAHGYKPSGAANSQSLALMAYFVKGPARDRWQNIVAALRERSDLKHVVETVLKTSLEEFEADWLRWCRERYAP